MIQWINVYTVIVFIVRQVGILLSKNQALHDTMSSQRSHVNQDISLRNAKQLM